MRGQDRYRTEIDGLRAIAVGAVILFHADFASFPGGFVGVDIFFVISGFLITAHIHNELEATGRIDILRFYERRIRRIFPAFFFMLLAVFAAGAIYLFPDELKLLGKSGIAATLFTSNFHFYFDSGYFAPAAASRPLLHTWSLAVEEQYYIFWPLIMWGLFRVARRHVLGASLLLGAASLLLSVAVTASAPTANFYMLPMRAWEFLAGGALAISGWSPRRQRALLAWCGIGLIGVAILAYSSSTPFPGLAAIPPVAGTVLLIAASRSTIVGRALSVPPMRALGLISYSLYLWHWPVLVFAREILGPHLSWMEALTCIALAIAVSAFSWRFVEQPFRRAAAREDKEDGSAQHTPAAVPVRTIAAGGAVMALSCLLAFGLRTGWPQRLPAHVVAVAAAAERPDEARYPCFAGQGPNPDVARCLAGGGHRRKVVVWGDSHMLPLVPALERRLGGSENLVFIGRGGCMPLAGYRAQRWGQVDQSCVALNTRVLDAIVSDPDVSAVVLIGRWARTRFPETHMEAQRLLAGDGARADADLALGASFDTLFARLKARGLKVIVLGDVPEFVEPAPQCLARVVWAGASPDRCAFEPETLPGSRSDRFLRALSARHPDVRFIWPTDVLCREGSCVRLLAGLPVNRDTDHLTEAAGDFLSTRSGLIEAIRTALDGSG